MSGLADRLEGLRLSLGLGDGQHRLRAQPMSLTERVAQLEGNQREFLEILTRLGAKLLTLEQTHRQVAREEATALNAERDAFVTKLTQDCTKGLRGLIDATERAHRSWWHRLWHRPRVPFSQAEANEVIR